MSRTKNKRARKSANEKQKINAAKGQSNAYQKIKPGAQMGAGQHKAKTAEQNDIHAMGKAHQIAKSNEKALGQTTKAANTKLFKPLESSDASDQSEPVAANPLKRPAEEDSSDTSDEDPELNKRAVDPRDLAPVDKQKLENLVERVQKRQKRLNRAHEKLASMKGLLGLDDSIIEAMVKNI